MLNCAPFWVAGGNLTSATMAHPHVNHLCDQHTHCIEAPSHLVVSWLDNQRNYSLHHNTCVHVTLFYLIMAPKGRRCDTDNLDMPKRNQKVLPLSEKAKSSWGNKERNKKCVEAAKIYGRTNLLVKYRRRKKFVLVLLSHSKLQKSFHSI